VIAVIGSTNMDVVMTVERFTRPGETQKAEKIEFFPGGKGANQAVTVAKLIGKCYFLTCVGNDEYGNFFMNYFKKLNIKGVQKLEEPTGRAFIELTKNGENRIIIVEGANGKLTKKILNFESNNLLKNEILLIQNEIPFSTTLEAVKMFKKNGKTVIFDPAPARNIDLEILKFVDFLTPNETEILELCQTLGKNIKRIEETFDLLSKFGLRNLIIKMGKKGVLFINPEIKISVSAHKVNVKDTTAAGDIFNAAFAVALIKGMKIKQALEFANAAAAISVTRKGAQPSIPSYNEIMRFLKIQN